MFVKSLVLFLTLYVQNGLSIRCIECNSANNSMCLDPTLYDKETLNHYMKSVECRYGDQGMPPGGNHKLFCRKIVQTILHKGSVQEVRITRGCGWKRDHRTRPCYKADNDDHLELVCNCFTDECNAADHTRLRLGVLALSFISAAFVQKIL